ncbi:MAG TPA: hypothetical protein VFV53_05215 [Candidatus Limnocylindrales bacterium]|nr:hypothetical protein [Candidatus Limnocylindrales bacterium]
MTMPIAQLISTLSTAGSSGQTGGRVPRPPPPGAGPMSRPEPKMFDVASTTWVASNAVSSTGGQSGAGEAVGIGVGRAGGVAATVGAAAAVGVAVGEADGTLEGAGALPVVVAQATMIKAARPAIPILRFIALPHVSQTG